MVGADLPERKSALTRYGETVIRPSLPVPAPGDDHRGDRLGPVAGHLARPAADQ
jgi:hypothetical protein